MTPTINLPCRIKRAHDGDTLSVEIVIHANVRLLDCWAPELKEDGGFEARDELTRLAVGQDGVLSIPLEDAKNLGDLFSFGRALGEVTVVGHELSVSKLMVKAKLASTIKGGKLGE